MLTPKLALFLLGWSLATGVCQAQDNFEIQVYEWETVPKGMWDLETHLNYTGRGTNTAQGTVAPSAHQFHMAYELTHGLTEHFELAGYLLLAHRAGIDGPLEYAGVRLRPRYSFPKEWGLPLDISISGEVGFPRKAYEENGTTLELRTILEKKVGKYQFDVNPTLARALRGPGTKDGWEFEPAVRLAYEAHKRFTASLEYYGATGPIGNPLPGREQGHQFYPGGDVNFNENLVLNFGVGMAVTDAGNRLVYKVRLGWMFGKKKA